MKEVITKTNTAADVFMKLMFLSILAINNYSHSAVLQYN